MSDVTIIYCRPCGYEKRAKEAAEAVRENLALGSTLVPGKGGVFQVKLGDQIVASRTGGHFQVQPRSLPQSQPRVAEGRADVDRVDRRSRIRQLERTV